MSERAGRSVKYVSTVKSRTFLEEMRRHGMIYVLAVPAIIYFIIFHYIPMPGAVIAFKRFNFVDGIFGSPWSGLENFRFYVESPALERTVRNTLLLNILNIGIGIVFQVGFALGINEIRLKSYKRVTQSVMIFPTFVSWIVMSIILYQLLNFSDGVVNRFLVRLGSEPHKWYQDGDAWLGIFLASHIWKGTGMGTVIYLASITSIDPELYDAAVVDGCGRFRQMWHITLPSIQPMIVILALLAVGRIFTSDVGSIYALIGDNSLLFKWLDTIDLYVFRNLRWNPNLSLSAAVGLMQSVINFVFVFTANWIVRRVYPEGALF